jgi:hypothetical protein
MAVFKDMGTPPGGETVRNEQQMQPLFVDFDPQTEGGLVILEDGLVAEVKHPTWVAEGKSTEPEDRIMVLPVRCTQIEGGETVFTWVSERLWDPRRPTLGSESEIEVRHMGRQHAITEDGVTLEYPDGTQEPLSTVGLDPEGYKQTVEFGTDVAVGWKQHTTNFINESVRIEQWLQEHDLETAYLSVLADASVENDITEHAWVQLINKKMRSLLEFNCISMQLHVQLASVEAGIHALTKYQGVQALFGLLTASSPVRDGSFDTTLAQHYHSGHQTNAGEPVLPNDDLIRHSGYADTVPYDWRELSRVLGSQSAGAFATVVPANMELFLREGDRQLRNGDTVSVVRTFGWHSDRLRLDKGTAEICNLGTAGGNIRKSLAVQEAVSKYIVALQQEYLRDANAAAWPQQYEHAVEVGQANNYFVGLSGKETKLIGEDGRPVAPQAMLASIRAFINYYSPEPLSDSAYNELQATLVPAPKADEFQSAEDVFKYFFQPGSRLTATDALRVAHQVEPARATNDMLALFSGIRREQLFREKSNLEYVARRVASLTLA